ncbi:beta-lactamase family protein [Roseomonas sp. NAR14]|uniref:Beta-lactamase family protein n=1 Tax=Roseomonas acroporae TaxID=2937791 RepID=A0A9X2BU67_9PROT|nr:serine hydrolase domain-containing protein [Roseomonas acroporae]MCK8785157.1 beta-lactamase family protein [Roseomonas acroporae]
MTHQDAADAVLRAAVEAGEVPGVVAMAATRDGVLYQGAFGRRGLDTTAPMTVDTLFWIASMTKAVTSVAAMQLVEAGRIGLDDPLGPVLEELRAPLVLEGFDADGAALVRPAEGVVTLRRLLTHTAGFGYDFWHPDIARYMREQGIPSLHGGDPAAFRVPLRFDPGTRWQYGISTDVAGRVVERLAGQGLGDYLRAHVFAPLGMDETGFGVPPAWQARLATRHRRDATGALAPIEFRAPERPRFESGGGGLFSTGPDYLRFLRMLLGGGTLDGVRLLRPETVAAMAENHIGALEVEPLPESDPPGFSNRAEFFPGMPKKWGLGFLINTGAAPGGGRAAGSLAWAGLANTYYWIDPSRGVTGLLLTQILPFADPAVLGLLDRFERSVYAALG